MEQNSTINTTASYSPKKSRKFPVLLGVVISAAILVAGAAFVRFNQQLAQNTAEIRSQAAGPTCEWCAGSPTGGGQCPAGQGFATDICSNGWCCIGNPGTGGPGPTGTATPAAKCDNNQLTAVACRDKDVGTTVPYSGGTCVCTRTTGTLCSCYDSTPPTPSPTGGTPACSGTCNPPGVTSCGSGLRAVADSSCGTGSNIRCCTATSLYTCYNRYNNCAAVSITQQCDGTNNFTTKAACDIAVASGPKTCYVKANNCAPAEFAFCNEIGNFSSLETCRANYCPPGTSYEPATSIHCYCIKSGNRNYCNPDNCSSVCAPTSCDGTTNKGEGCSCSGGFQCGSGFCNKGVCTSKDALAVCPNTPDSASVCVPGPSALIGGYDCRDVSDQVTLMTCCPNGYINVGERCQAPASTYPLCGTGLICDFTSRPIIGSQMCRQNEKTTEVIECCQPGYGIVGDKCVPLTAGMCDDSPATHPLCRNANGGEVGYSPPGSGCTCQSTSGTVCGCIKTGTNPGGQCISAGFACSTASSDNGGCCAGSYCQGASSKQFCQTPVGNVCPGGGVCGGNQGYIGFKCSSLTSGQCLENPETFDTYAKAREYAGTCGQVDTVCNGGDRDRNLCGAFEIISSGCGGGSSSPQPSPSPTPPAPMCLNIAMSPAQPSIGSSVTFTCGQVAGVHHYEFRVRVADGSIQLLAASSSNSNVSMPLQISEAGTYKAQCRICTGAASNTCQAFEPI